MHLSLRLLVLLIAASPAIIFVDNPAMSGLVAGITAAAIGIVAFSIRSAEAQYLSSLLRPVVIVIMIPAIWMIIQVIPMPFGGLSHPIWTSAAMALDMVQFGGMSIDPGATLISLTRYFCAAGIGFVTSAITVDRRGAERVLFALVGSATVTAVISLVYRVGGFAIFGTGYDTGHAAVMAAISVLGTIIAAAAIIRMFERYRTRRPQRDMTQGQFWKGFAIWLSAWSICWFAISGRPANVFAAACGTATLATIEVVRRLGVDRRTSAAIAAAAIVVAITVVATQPSGPNDITLRFAASAPPQACK